MNSLERLVMVKGAAGWLNYKALSRQWESWAKQLFVIRELNLEVQRMVHVIRDCSFLVLSLSKFID